MSESFLDLETWPEGITAARIPANNNTRAMEAFIGPAISATTTAQPVSPAERDIYIIPASATGTNWATFTEGDVAIFFDATWTAFSAFEGLRKTVLDEGADGENWQYLAGVWAVEAGGGGGSGDVVGPASAVDGTVALYDGTTGKLLKAGGKTIPQLMLQSIQIACSDLTTNITTGTGKAYFRMPYAFTLTAVRASVFVAQTAGSILTFDINENGTTILSTKLTIDNSEKTSTTAATPAVISDTSLADDAEITIDFDQVGTALAKGVIITLIGYPT